MVDKSFIEKIEEMNSVKLEDIEGKVYSNKKLYLVEKPVYSHPLMNIATLHGAVTYLYENKDNLTHKNLMIVVNDYSSVTVVTRAMGYDNHRETILQVTLDQSKAFPYELFFNKEDFTIALRSTFEDTPDLADLLAYSGKVSDESSVKTEDDGITEHVQVKQGLSGARTEDQLLPVKVTLKPFRTFLDIDQPESEFLFRMKKAGDGIECALFQSDGGFWRNKARNNIRNYFQKNIEDITVIA